MGTEYRLRQKLLEHPHGGHVNPCTRHNDGALGFSPSGGQVERLACECRQEFDFGKAGLARRVLAGLQYEAADAAACMVRIGVHGPHVGRFAPRGQQFAVPVRPALGRDETPSPGPAAATDRDPAFLRDKIGPSSISCMSSVMTSKLAASCSGVRNGTRSTRVDRSIRISSAPTSAWVARRVFRVMDP